MQLYLALPSTVLKINMFCNKLNFRLINFIVVDLLDKMGLQTYKSEHFFKPG
jgi:hypothetical protein